MNILKFFRPHPEGGRCGSTKVDEIEALLTANGGVRTKAEGSEYLYRWDCQGYVVFVHYRYGTSGNAYAYYGIQ